MCWLASVDIFFVFSWAREENARAVERSKWHLAGVIVSIDNVYTLYILELAEEIHSAAVKGNFRQVAKNRRKE